MSSLAPRVVAPALLVALAIACGAAAQEKEKKNSEPVFKVYDVGFLTLMVEDQRGLKLHGLDTGDEGATGAVATEASSGGAIITPEEIINVIRANFGEDSWEDGKHSLVYNNGHLFVVNLPEVHDMISRYLAALRARRGQQIAIEATVIEMTPAVADALDAAAPADGGGVVLAPAQLEIIDKALAQPEAARIVRVARVKAFPGQQVNVRNAHTEAYVRDYDVEIAQDAVIADPTPALLDEGFRIAFRPNLEFGDARVTLEIRFDQLELAAPLTAYDTLVPKMGQIHLPALRGASLNENLTLPLDATALAGMVSASPGNPDGKLLALLVRPRLLRIVPVPAEVPESAEKRLARMFDVGFLVINIADFPGLELGPHSYASSSDGTVSAAFSEDIAAGVLVSPEVLVDLLKQNVAQASWNNARNTITLVGASQLLVVQTPDVLGAIQAYLAKLAKDRGRFIAVDAIVLEAGGKYAGSGIRKAPLGEGDTLAPEAMRALLAEARKGGDLRVLGQASAAAFNSQRVHIRSTISRSYVGDYDVEIATNSQSWDPIVMHSIEGLQLDVRPTLVGDDATIQLDLRPSLVLPSRDLESFSTHAGAGGRIQLPAMDLFLANSNPIVRDGQWTVATVAGSPNGSASQILLVRARVTKVP